MKPVGVSAVEDGMEVGRVVPCEMALKLGMDGIGGWRGSRAGACPSEEGGIFGSWSCCCVFGTVLMRELFETAMPEDWGRRKEEPDMSSERWRLREVVGRSRSSMCEASRAAGRRRSTCGAAEDM